MIILPLTRDTLDLEIDLCLQCHPSGYIVAGIDAIEGRNLKKALFDKIFRVLESAGYVAIEDDAPISLLELMPRKFARRNGYITGSTGSDDEVLTIVCLEVAYGWDRKHLMRVMVRHLVENIQDFSPFKYIEVGAFSQDVSFHPSWVYLEAGFHLVEDRINAGVYSIELSS
jgi:hypothetical protein